MGKKKDREWWLDIDKSCRKHLKAPRLDGYYLPPAERAFILSAVDKFRKDFFSGEVSTEIVRGLTTRYKAILREQKEFRENMKKYTNIEEIKKDVDKGIHVYHGNDMYEVVKMHGSYIVWCAKTSFSGGKLELYADEEWISKFYSKEEN